MNPMTLIQYMYFLGLGAIASGLYLMVVYAIMGDAVECMEQAAHTAMQLAVTLWFRRRYDLWP